MPPKKAGINKVVKSIKSDKKTKPEKDLEVSPVHDQAQPPVPFNSSGTSSPKLDPEVVPDLPLLREQVSSSDKPGLDSDYIPITMNLTVGDPGKSIASYNPSINFSSNIDYPLFSLGFHYFIHSNKNKTVLFNQFEGKKKVYQVLNKFERYIDNYTDSIGSFSEKFFETGHVPLQEHERSLNSKASGTKNGPPNILSRGFYKLWEILHMFDLIDLEKPNFTSAHLAEGPGSFIQATMFFRDKYSSKSKSDKYYGVTLHPENSGVHVPPLEKSFIDYYEQEKPQRFFLHKTWDKQTAGSDPSKSNGDLTDPKTLVLFGGQIGPDKADFITADGGFNWSNENTQEQEAFRLIFAQIAGAIKLQALNGSFVCKFFETFTNTSLKFIYLLTQCYKSVVLTKPLTSRASNSEKYAVCQGFKYKSSDPEYKKIIEQIDLIMGELHKNPSKNLVGLWPDAPIDLTFKKTLTLANVRITNQQLKSINEIITFIKEENYYGDVYQMSRQMQIDAAKYWIGRFMPDKKDWAKIVKTIRAETEQLIKVNSDEKLLPRISSE